MTSLSHDDLSRDHNPVQFIIETTTTKPYTHNCTVFTNWNLYQELLTTSIPGNPVIADTGDVEEKISQFTSNIHQADNQSSKFKVITHDVTFIPKALRLKISEKNRIRKLWQTTRFPPLKQSWNRLQRQIKNEMKSIMKKNWDERLDEANNNNDLLHKIIKSKKKNQITYPPLLGYRGLVYGTLEKANLFADTLEEPFKENTDPYDNEHIEKVERQVCRYLSNLSFQTPPLTSPGETYQPTLYYRKIILKRINQHADANNCIPDFQHGFREERATSHQLLRLTNLVINSYLRDRSFQVKIASTLSRTAPISAGCPQRSILSPILYSLYTQDFPTTPTVDVCLFADDAAIVAQAYSPDLPILTYACQIWGSAAPSNISLLQIEQNKALRSIMNYPRLKTHPLEDEEEERDENVPQAMPPRFLPPAPITIDNVNNTAAFLKQLQNMTKENLMGRIIGKGLRIYPPSISHN
ncbi:RNA-directed DNA polymerase from mobile element jockey [Trichonephila clavipes]|nr:RNA-directed DNA polymerase from mobile element jockey [Trichonephila clavipes]